MRAYSIFNSFVYVSFLLNMWSPNAARAASPQAPSPTIKTQWRLTLQQAIDRALAESPELAALDSLIAASEAEIQRARANRMPDVSAIANYARWSNVPEFFIPTPEGGSQKIFPNIPNNYGAGLRATLALYTGGRIGSGINAATQHNQVVYQHRQTGKIDLRLQVAITYWRLILAAAAEEVLTQSIASFEAHLQDVRNRQSFGLAARNDVLAIQVERDKANLERLQAANAYSVTLAKLRRLLVLPAEADIEAIESLESAQPLTGDLEDFVNAAHASRPELAAATAQLAAATARVDIEKAAMKPQVWVAAGFDYARPNRRILPWTDEFKESWEASVQFSYDLYDGGKRSADIAQATALVANESHRFESLKMDIRLQVTSSYLDVLTSQESVRVAEKNLESARENVKVATDRFREGLIASSDLLDAETALLRSGLDRASALAQLRISTAMLQRAVNQ